MLVFSIFAILLLVFYIQHVAQKNLDTRTQFRLFGLRDKLRNLAIENKVNETDRIFKFLDTSITKIISDVSRINLWLIVIYYFQNINRKDYLENKEEFFKELQQPIYNSYLEIFNELASIIGAHLISQHYILKYLLMGIAKPVKTLQPLFAKTQETIRSYPTFKQSSTFDKYFSVLSH